MAARGADKSVSSGIDVSQEGGMDSAGFRGAFMGGRKVGKASGIKSQVLAGEGGQQ